MANDFPMTTDSSPTIINVHGALFAKSNGRNVIHYHIEYEQAQSE